MEKKLSRRKFLAGAGMVGAGMVAVACAPKAAPPGAVRPRHRRPRARRNEAPPTAVWSLLRLRLALQDHGPRPGGAERYRTARRPGWSRNVALQALPADQKPESDRDGVMGAVGQ
jgi:hypothetical protein